MRDLSDGQQIWTESAIPLVNYVARRQDGLAGVGVLHGSPDMLTRSSVFAGAIGETANFEQRGDTLPVDCAERKQDGLGGVVA